MSVVVKQTIRKIFILLRHQKITCTKEGSPRISEKYILIKKSIFSKTKFYESIEYSLNKITFYGIKTPRQKERREKRGRRGGYDVSDIVLTKLFNKTGDAFTEIL